jgi:hypothetical protein
VKLDWMMLTNHAEVVNGLLYISGGSWDTLNIGGPLPDGAPEGAVGAFTGTLVIRLLFHVTETGREHELTITIVDEDGAQIADAGGRSEVLLMPNLPPGWDQGMNVAVPFTGLLLPRFGLYTIHVQVNGQHVGSLPFRVVKAYE